MAEGIFEPSPMQLDAEEIVGRLVEGKPDLIDDARATLKKESPENIGKLLATGEGVTEDEPEPDAEEIEGEPELVAEEIIVPSDEDIQTVMSKVLEEDPKFAAVDEKVRLQIVQDAICTVLAEEVPAEER
jgi:hypothetical protein